MLHSALHFILVFPEFYAAVDHIKILKTLQTSAMQALMDRNVDQPLRFKSAYDKCRRKCRDKLQKC